MAPLTEATGPKRGRPSLRQVAEIDQRVIEAAAKCFIANGYAGTTMHNIAAEAGVTKPTLYQRYADKEALLRAVVHRKVDAWSETAVNRKVERGSTLADRLRYYGRSMLYWNRQPDVRAFGELISECRGSAPKVAEEVDAIRTSRMLRTIEADIVSYGASDGLTAKDPKMLAAMFYAMIAGHATAMDDQEADPDAAAVYVDLVVDILMRGSVAWS